jgi:hypothetical protein
LAIEIANPDWPAEVVRLWGRGRTDAAGAFRVLCGLEERVEIHLGASSQHGDVFTIRSGQSEVLRLAQ